MEYARATADCSPRLFRNGGSPLRGGTVDTRLTRYTKAFGVAVDGLKPGRKLSVRVNLQRNRATHAYNKSVPRCKL